ncbi:MAG TPA: F0F1 ATP synthase subunit delta [Xanthobacteraceae bacterium]|nr:F0F1 ATP synthase subunit delta [Xanthobacteraceae bacterium]
MADHEPIISGMAGRYATALFELAQEAKSLDAVKGDLDRFSSLLEGSEDLVRLVRSPVFTAEEQTKAIEAILAKANIGGLAGKFIATVASNRRLFAVGQMIAGFNALVARSKGETRAEVTVAEKLEEKHLATIKEAIAASGQKNVTLDVKIDPSILGGLKVKIGSRMIDASLKTKLNSIRNAMKEVR